MNVTLTRESINMGDDSDAPHFADVEVPDDATWGQLLETVNASKYHHISAGSKMVWEVSAHLPPGPVAAVVRYDELYYVIPPETPAVQLFPEGRFWLHFEYTTGDPRAIRDKLLAQ